MVQYHIRHLLVLTGWWAVMLSVASMLGGQGLLKLLEIVVAISALLAVLMVVAFTIAAPLHFVRRRIHAFWDRLDTDPE